MNKNEELSPNDLFVAISAYTLSDLERKSLSLLYRPMMNTHAYSLITYLWEVTDLPKVGTDLKIHVNLLKMLGIDCSKIIEARKELEALGLIRTFCKKEKSRNIFIYKLYKPLLPYAFFKDDALSVLLLSYIGENTVKELVDIFTPRKYDLEKYSDISTEFDSVYTLRNKTKLDLDILNKLPNSISDNSNSVKLNDKFDFNLLIKLLEKSYVESNSIEEHRNLIMVEQTLYGISEHQMSEYINQATDFTTNKLQSDRLKNIIYQQAKPINNNFQQDIIENDNIKIESSNNFSKEEQELLALVKKLAPFEFLSQLKSQVGGFVANNESKIIEDLIQNSHFKPEVINFLIYYVIVDQDNAYLNRNFIDAIANDWMKSKIKSSEQALTNVKKHTKKVFKSSNSYNKQKKVQKESLPAWAVDNSESKVQQISKKTGKQKKIDINIDDV